MLNRRESAWLDVDESGGSFLLVGIGDLGDIVIGVTLLAHTIALMNL
jgi:hypothetical protein